MAHEIIVAYFCRHGQTTLNAQNMFRGAMNPDLNAKGRQDANILAKYFEPIDLSAIFYSDKKRSTETAQIISAKKPEIGCFGTPNLWAWNVGKFSGKEKTTENKAELEHYIQNPDIPIPDGESLNEFKSRIRPCIKEAIQVADEMGAPTICVVHSSVIHEVGSMINSDNTSALVEPGGVCAISYDSEHGRLSASPIFKKTTSEPGRADTVS